jgi:hypothetical protein
MLEELPAATTVEESSMLEGPTPSAVAAPDTLDG